MFAKRIISTCMAVTMMALLITGCGKDGGKDGGKDSGNKDANGTEASADTSAAGDSTPAAAGEFYSGDTREELLYGRYLVDRESFMALEKDYQSFMDGMGIMDYDNDGTNVRLSALPMEMNSGRYGYLTDDGTLYSHTNFPSEEELEEKRTSLVSQYGEDGVRYFNNYMEALNAPHMTLRYIVEADEYVEGKILVATFTGFYKVSGNTVTVYSDEPDPETYELKYEKAEVTFDFDFSNRGSLLLSNEGSEVELLAEAFSSAATVASKLLVNSYIADGDEMLDDIASIYLIEGFSASLNYADGTTSYGTEMEFNNNGTFTIRWKGKAAGLELSENPGEISGNFIYAYGSGVILTVDGKTYYYTDSERDFFGNTFADLDTENMQADAIAAIASAQKNIRSELEEAFEKAGISVTIDEKTGEVTTDDSILFGVDESELSDEGKAYLDSFLEVYVQVVQPYIEDGFISEIMVEGHTDTSGSYDYNLKLSEDRAKSVATYCTEKQPAIGGVLTSKGFSFENPVLDASGNIDMNASRRVVFSFKMGEGK